MHYQSKHLPPWNDKSSFTTAILLREFYIIIALLCESNENSFFMIVRVHFRIKNLELLKNFTIIRFSTCTKGQPKSTRVYNKQML